MAHRGTSLGADFFAGAEGREVGNEKVPPGGQAFQAVVAVPVGLGPLVERHVRGHRCPDDWLLRAVRDDAFHHGTRLELDIQHRLGEHPHAAIDRREALRCHIDGVDPRQDADDGIRPGRVRDASGFRAHGDLGLGDWLRRSCFPDRPR